MNSDADDAVDDLIATCTSKKAYRTVDAAGRAAATAKQRRGVDLRVYQCPLGHYHLTKAVMNVNVAEHVLDIKKKVTS